MKKINLKAIKFLCFICLTFFIVSCEPTSEYDNGELEIFAPVSYKNDGPLASVSAICNVLCFNDDAHFDATYEYLEERYEDNQDQDSVASLDAFQAKFNYTSRRNFVDEWEADMDDQGISIDASNDIDTLFFGEDVMQTLLNEKCIVKIGTDAVLMLDECLWIRVPFNNCQGIELLGQLFDRLGEKGEAANEAATEFLLQNKMVIESPCEDSNSRAVCDFGVSFSYQDPVLNQLTGFYEILLTDETKDKGSESKWRVWRLADNELQNPALFIDFLGNTDLSATRKNVKLRVPIYMDKISVVLSKRESLFGCKQEVLKTIYFNCPYPDWSYIDDNKIKFETRNSKPGTQVIWGFGDNLNTTSKLLNPVFDYNLSCRETIFYTFNITSPSTDCNFDYLNKIRVGPRNFKSGRTKARDWYKLGSKKFKWKLVTKGRKGKVKAVIKSRNKTDLKIQLLGNIYDESTCTLLNDLAVVSSVKAESGKKRMKIKYLASTPFSFDINNPIRAYFEAGGISATFDVFD